MNKILLIATLSLSATASFAAHELENRDITNGQALYAENCAACHGAQLQGQPNWQTPDENGTMRAPPHDASGHTWHHDNQLLFDYTWLGGQQSLAARGVTGFSSNMPAFQDTIIQEDVWDILGYIRSTWPEYERRLQDSRNPPHN